MKIILCKGRFAGPISGADETIVSYAIAMKAAGHDVTVAVLYPFASGDAYCARLQAAGLRVDCIARTSPLGAAMQFIKRRVPHMSVRMRHLLQQTASSVSMSYVDVCRKYFLSRRADVAHVVTPDPAAMAMIRGACDAGTPVLYQELGTPDFLPELNFYYEQLKKVLPLCSAVAVLSPELGRRFSETMGGFSRTSVLPLIVDDVARLETSPGAKFDVTFGFAARMEYGKAPLTLVNAFAQLRRRVSRVSLRMAGDGPQRKEVETLACASALDGTCSFVGTYTGPVQRSAFMRSIDVFVLPSLAEGTPNGIIEAMAHGLPVIASAIGGIPDTVSPDSGILVNPGDVDALVEAMAALATDPERRAVMGKAARQQYERKFSPAAVMPVLTDLYERVVRSPQR
jgi:glycosyltransferase involved in cell wall biosynthesis